MINEQSSKAKHSSWWKRRTRLEKWLLLLLIIAIVVIIIILAVKLRPNPPAACFSPSCIHTAAKVLEKVDLSLDPCQDFYKFTCGRFVNETVLPPSKSVISSFSIVSDMVDDQMRTLLERPIEASDTRSSVIVKSLYQACMNTTEIEASALPDLKRILKSIGGWPVVEGQRWKEVYFDWIETSYEFMRLGFDVDFFFEFGVEVDVANSSKHLLTLDQPYIVSFDKTMRKGFSENLVQAYYDYMVKVAVGFGADVDRARKHMKDVIDLDISIMRITVPAENRRNSSLEYNPFTIRELQQRFMYLRWLEYINKMVQPIKKMTDDDVVVVTLPQYFEQLGHVIKSTPKKTLANYMYWKVVKALITYLNSDLRNLQLEFSKIMSGRSEREPRWRECIQKTKRVYIASGALYVKHFFKKEAKQTMLEMVHNIKAQFLEILKKVDWMDDVTRKHALEKAQSIESHIAYPEELLNATKIDQFYKNLTVDPLKYLQSLQNVSRFSQQLAYARLDQPADRKDWRSHAFAVVTNAFYDQSENSIEFPASLLQDVFFDNDRPHYMNYGAIGYVIGHEITHGFDDEGRQFDKDGRLIDWWQPATESAFQKKAQCIIDQYGNITIPEINMTLNGINTQGENIADNGGIKQAYLAYKKWVNEHAPEDPLPGLPYTPEQMFWISVGNTWCDVERREHLKNSINDQFHPPHVYRVNVPLMNSEYFAEDFNCPKGSPMNPAHKCVVW